jgi:hypothetical protein
MSSSTTTNTFREGLADSFLASLTGAQMKFGDGGHNPETEVVLAANPAQTDLNNPLITKDLLSATKPDAYSVKAVGRLDKEDLVGVKVSEAGLFVGAQLSAIRNFGPKTKEDDEAYDVEIIISF